MNSGHLESGAIALAGGWGKIVDVGVAQLATRAQVGPATIDVMKERSAVPA
jgi:hypothetical protein